MTTTETHASHSLWHTAHRKVTFLVGKVIKKWGLGRWQLETARTHRQQRVEKETLESSPQTGSVADCDLLGKDPTQTTT
jgi:hypothetical protein